MAAYRKVIFQTHDGGRYVESIGLDGLPAFKVWDPRTLFQLPDRLGYVRIVTRKLPDGTVVFAEPTVTGLRRLGVELEDLELAA